MATKITRSTDAAICQLSHSPLGSSIGCDVLTGVETTFRRLFRIGKPVPFGNVVRDAKKHERFDRRVFGAIPARMHRDGEIVKAGYRTSESAKHHAAIKQRWRLA
ncbi:hypothetical protein CA51_51290 [Rosistilla oblonga]|nr:hypothetical protein CA51_51290 [Rosistilla oblonga]